MIDVGEDRPFEIIRPRIPRSDVGRVEFIDSEADIPCKHGMVGLDFFPGPAETLFGQFGDGAGLANPVAEFRRHLLVLVGWVKRLWKLHEDVSPPPPGCLF